MEWWNAEVSLLLGWNGKHNKPCRNCSILNAVCLAETESDMVQDNIVKMNRQMDFIVKDGEQIMNIH